MSSNAPVPYTASDVVIPAGFTESVDLLIQTYAQDLSPREFGMALASAHNRGLSIVKKQIYFWKQGGKVIEVVGIDGYRAQAESSGEYAGQDGPFWCGEDGVWKDVWLSKEPPMAAKVGVRRRGFNDPIFEVALFAEYNAPNKDIWKKLPTVMLAKCFDQYTEVLTDRGFQRFADVTGKIMQVTESGIEPTDAQPFVQDYDGDMVALDSDDLNFVVTPNHDMITTEGKIEAGELFERSRSRPQFLIPRSVKGTGPGLPVSDDEIRLAAAYLADGADRTGLTFRVSVSRPHKVEMLRGLNLAISENVRHCAGDKAYTNVRTITTRTDKTQFTFAQRQIAFLCEVGKRIRISELLRMSRHQARVFVDTLVALDGHKQKDTGVRRFYTSRVDHLEAFEIAAVAAGYSVNRPKARYSDIAKVPNYSITISDRDEIPVIRWGRGKDNRSKGNTRGRTGIHVETNTGGKVWCVTVPSGVIVVRRNGFSMLCGNCAEARALRKAFPENLGGTYTSEELDQAKANAIETTGTVRSGQRQQAPRQAVASVSDPNRDEAKSALWSLAHGTYGWSKDTLNQVAINECDKALDRMSAVELKDLTITLSTANEQQRDEIVTRATAIEALPLAGV